MLKIIVVCGMGLGSSHYISMNVIDILKSHEIHANVENCDLLSAFSKEGHIFIGADYFMEQLEDQPFKVCLDDLFDKEELEKKLLEAVDSFYESN
ncbi:PTS sugar transporter subunit IIB [Anaeromicrobium sediminis]|uniref:Phosphotransferase system EIIB component type 2/3 domain-containing protein n=1 Tax=Anaeromicrobium sediminis TaxID=1478221 RepID=A0A267MKP0_9FIRM|nr:PTS lactose transporter subunit IIB [Anaeromicrobium sediminis]PAB59987.1 hypothetical protein CCE28_06325 [Anaeromicrobium sediminis]